MWAYFNSHCIIISLDRSGVIYGKKTIPWQQVRRISGALEKGGYHLVIGVKGFRPDYHLMADKRLTLTEYENLINLLRRELKPHHSSIEVG